ncbi:CRAL-TRIO domain-containing protein [Pilobolus umbonatus]|nr:CRAL-TRIO domain-containing protein [Pilobolus umbonatus]
MADSKNITPKQQDAVNELRQSLSKSLKDLPENLLILYLEANVWNMNDARTQLLDTIEWREKMDIDHIPVATKYNKLPPLVACRGYKYIDDCNFAASPEMSESVIRVTSFTGGDCLHKFDKEGHPLLIDRTGYHNTKKMANDATSLEITNFYIAINEFLRRVILPESAEISGKDIFSETIIFDCENMSIWQLQMNAFYHIKALVDIVQHYYPETLHRLFIVNAPSAFVVMFKIVKPWLNARTLEKIHVLGSNYQSVLLSYIDAKNLPRFLGGECTCSHMEGGCVPSIPLQTQKKPIPTPRNEKVPTIYITEIMKAAMSDPELCTLKLPA